MMVRLLGGLGVDDNGAVSLLAHQYNVGTVDDDFLVVAAFTNQYLEND